jgi:O-antigen ligase
MLFFGGWAVLSLAWADDTALTFRRLVIFAILCLAAAAIARRFWLHEIVLLMFVCTALFLLIGVSAEIALGTFQPFTPDYRFAGTLHPNHQGINCALLVLSGVAAADTEKRRRVLFRALALLGLVFLVLTASRTAFAAGMLALAVYWVKESSRAAKVAVSFGLGVVFCLLLLWFRADALGPALRNAALLGRVQSADSFDGRTSIWGDVGHYIRQRPIIGWGYGGFWNERHLSEISDIEGWGVGGGHSSYVDCLVDLGLVGLAAYIFILLGGVAQSFANHRASRDPAFAFSGAFLIFCLADGLLESAMLEGTFLMFFSMTALIRLAFVYGPELTGGGPVKYIGIRAAIP